MSDITVKNSVTGDMGPIAAKRARYEKSEIAYGKIPAAAFAEGDTLIFEGIPMKHLIYARFTANGETLELYTGADLSSAVEFDIVNDGSSADLSYYVVYIRGTGKVKAAGTYVGDGELIQLDITSSAP